MRTNWGLMSVCMKVVLAQFFVWTVDSAMTSSIVLYDATYSLLPCSVAMKYALNLKLFIFTSEQN